MNKKTFAVLLLIFIILFSGADYALNIASFRPFAEVVTAETPEPYPNLTQALLERNPIPLGYQISKRQRTTYLFEKTDLSSFKDLRVYRNELTKSESNPIILYEVQGPPNQGGVSYLSVKVKLKTELSASETLNETNQFGHSSFYFNDLNTPSIAFLLVQAGDHLYGFQYSKTEPRDFDAVKDMISTLLIPYPS